MRNRAMVQWTRKLIIGQPQESNLAFWAICPTCTTTLNRQGPSCLCIIPRDHFVGANNMVPAWELSMEGSDGTSVTGLPTIEL